MQPWDIAFDSGFLYIADFGSIKQFKASNGKLENSVILDSLTSGLAGIGSASGITVEPGDNPDAKIIFTDVTVGNVAVINKRDFSVYKVFNTQLPPFPNTGTAFTQPFSTVRVVTSEGPPVQEYYLTTRPDTDFTMPPHAGDIVKFMEDPTDPTGVSNSVFFSGLWAPVKLKLHNGYVYVVEAGDLLNAIPQSPGRVSRIPLNNPSTREILVDNLKNPQGLDIFDDTMVIVETGSGTKRLLQASASEPSAPIELRTKLDLSDDLLIYEFSPVPINPFTGVAVDSKGKNVYVNQTQPDNILELKLHLGHKQHCHKKCPLQKNQ